MNILLIAGGWSPERPVSLAGAQKILEALRLLGHSVTLFDPEKSLQGLAEAAWGQDFAFINLHGAPGEDGVVQAMLARMGLPYQGSGPAGSFLALHKDAAKSLFRRQGLHTPDWLLLHELPAPDWEPPFAYPLFIKSNTGGSSLGLARVDRPEDLEPALQRLFAGGGDFLVEPACAGREVTCGVLGTEALPPILIVPKAEGGKFFDYASKYVAGAADELCPAPLPEDTLQLVRETALQAHRVLGLRGYSRADFILGDNNALTLLEVNTLPGMTPNSLVPRAASAMGMSFDRLVQRLIDLGMECAAECRAE
ncbi:MAG: D-alanine--D-alanine ligase [Deltaproteobacteria bacterium]|jgi:D-alanine-D-alanine ligase|nr:D-alanine--D-alanine ligase [Deltaproteobacteria bacterium]